MSLALTPDPMDAALIKAFADVPTVTDHVTSPSKNPNFEIKSVQPSAVTAEINGEQRKTFLPSIVLERPLNIACAGAAGFIGKFITRQLSGEQMQMSKVTFSGDVTPESEEDLTSKQKTDGVTLEDAKAKFERKIHDRRIEAGYAPDKVAKTFEEMLEDPDVDAVIIATPNAEHFKQAEAALHAGKHVFCEKPVGINAEEAQKLEALASTQGLVFHINNLYTGCPTTDCFTQIIKDGKITIIPDRLEKELELGEEPFDIEFQGQREVNVNYLQSWVKDVFEQQLKEANGDLEQLSDNLGLWRLMPDRAGPSCAFGDVGGTHGVELAMRVLDMEPAKVKSCTMIKDINGFEVSSDVDATAVIEMEDKSEITVRASQIEQGKYNDLSIAIKYDNVTLTWNNQTQEFITLDIHDGGPHDGKQIVLRRNVPPLANISADAVVNEQTAFAHPYGHGLSQQRHLDEFASAVTKQIMLDQGVTQEYLGASRKAPDARTGYLTNLMIDQAVEVAA